MMSTGPGGGVLPNSRRAAGLPVAVENARIPRYLE